MNNKRKSEEESDYPSKRTSDLIESQDATDEINETDVGSNSSLSSIVNQKAVCGIIESVVVENFMCHRHLTTKLGSSVNFIIGKNGSGKSAILTAVVIGLGGTANNTNRGSSVKSFIQQGKQKAEIIIKIHNLGSEAFKPNVYGDMIIVQRTIRSNGVSHYNIKDYSGKVVSTHKSELNLILDYFNIQVDNPISILNQELSRQFLRNEDPKSKYKLFMKATQLEQISRDYNWADQHRRLAKETLDLKKKTLPHLNSEVKDWKAKYDFFTSIDGFKNKKKVLRGELAWAQILGIENELKDELSKGSQLKTQLAQAENRLDNLQIKKTGLEIQSKEINSEIEALNTYVESLKSSKKGKKSILDEKKINMHKHRSLLSQLENQVRITTIDRDRLLARIEELQSGEANMAAAAEKERRALEITELENKLNNIEASSTTTQHHCDQLKISVNQFMEELANLKNDERMLNNHLNTARRNLREAENARGDQQKRFGQWVPEVLSEIEKLYSKGIFRHKPRGPLGLHIKVKDPKWYLAMETCIAGSILAFTCDNKDDEKKLEQLLLNVVKKCGNKMPSIIVSPFENQVYDVRRNCVVHDKYSSALDLLEIDDPVVTNCLIDQAEIERILFIDNNNAARQLMLRCPPRNCKEAYTLEADRIFPAPRFRFYSGRSSRVNYFKDVGDNIGYYKKEIENLNSQIQGLNLKVTTADKRLSENRQQYNKTDTSLMQMHIEKSQINRKLIELRNVEEPDSVATMAYEEDLRIFTQQIEDGKININKIKHLQDTCNAEILELQKELNIIDNELRSKCDDNLFPLKENLIVYTSELGEIEGKLQFYKKGQESLIKKIEELESDSRLKRKDVDMYIELANKSNLERPETIRTEKEIENEIKAVTKHLETAKETHGNKEEVTLMYCQAVKKSKMIEDDVENLDRFLLKIDTFMKMRRANYDRFRCAVGMRVAQHFTSAYHRRNQGIGRIDFDHKRETLTITVQANNSEIQSSQNMRSLSGGERSFSTVAFILALWEAIDSPFRMLDEFDVFMDMVNRRLSMSLLLDFAKNHLQNQFIFFTPLEMTHIDASDDVRIFKMRDPERNQAVLPFRPVNETNEDDV